MNPAFPGRTGTPATAYDVVIVGGGMGGLALGLALGRRGRTVAILERQAGLRPLRRGELLQPNGLRLLDQLGLLSKVKARPSRTTHRFHFHRIGGERLCTVDYGRLPPPWNYALALEPHHLLDVLLSEIGAISNIQLLTETEFTEPIRKEGRVSGVRVRRAGALREIAAPLIVGSDGAFSRLRESVGIPARVHVYRESYLTFVISGPDGAPPEARYYVGRGEILGVFPLSDEKLYLFYMIQRKDLDRIKQSPVRGVLDRIARIDAGAGRSLNSIRSWEEVGWMPCHRVRAARWSADGAVLMGDAAHAMNPHVAQGRNQALEDAMALVGPVSRAFERNDFSAGVFEDYEASRRPAVEALQAQADEMVFFWNPGFPPLTWLRDRVFRRLDCDGALRYKILALIAGQSNERLSAGERIRISGLNPLSFRSEKV